MLRILRRIGTAMTLRRFVVERVSAETPTPQSPSNHALPGGGSKHWMAHPLGSEA